MKTAYLKRIDDSDMAIIGVRVNMTTLHGPKAYITPVAMIHVDWIDDLFGVDPAKIDDEWTAILRYGLENDE